MRILKRFITRVSATVGMGIKSISVGINQNIFNLITNNPFNQLIQFFTISSKGNIMSYLRRGISKPHSRNITSKHKVTPILQSPGSCLQCTKKTSLEHLRQFGIRKTLSYLFRYFSCFHFLYPLAKSALPPLLVLSNHILFTYLIYLLY